MNKATRRQIARTAGGQDLWPRKSVAHSLRSLAREFPGIHGRHQEWHKEYIKRGLGDSLAGPVGVLP